MIQRNSEERVHTDVSPVPKIAQAASSVLLITLMYFWDCEQSVPKDYLKVPPFKLKTNCSLALNSQFSDYFLRLLVLQTSPRGLSPCRTDVQSSTRPPHPPSAGHLSSRHFTHICIFLLPSTLPTNRKVHEAHATPHPELSPAVTGLAQSLASTQHTLSTCLQTEAVMSLQGQLSYTQTQ